MVLTIKTYPDPVLLDGCEAIEEITDEIRDELVPNMIETMYEKDGVGLAAPQIGRAIRLICADPTGPKNRADLHVIVNPEIVEREGTIESEEACLSVVQANCKIDRSAYVKIKGLDINGKPIEIEAEGYFACILQHEIDHLDGKTIVNYMGRLKRSMYEKKVKKWQKQAQAYSD